MNHDEAVPLFPPALLLDELGINEPRDIDIEAVAEFCGATIVYDFLEGCEARLIGYNDKAIITVNCMAQRERQRFSAGHELGHWMQDRGQTAFSCKASTFATEWWQDNPERRANRYATDLLLPEGMFRARARGREMTFATVRALAEEFQTSLTATAIRLIELGSFPAMIICNEVGVGRRWFIRGPDVPDALWPREMPRGETIAFELLHGESKRSGPLNVYADGWINHPDARRYKVREDSVKITPRLVLSLLWWENESQPTDREGDAASWC
ncbi:MAG TPA: ImmA/IrrE family metallo-endopeptidase [Blastocatellia bacterium]|nr:ImmA/IrrE family metallo-endopeptidase [Blastocatellia bacterium]